ncbi:hypothetical protein Taro_053694 [Colocasia esculenta]|uniref:Uncharacterized protein n=1 Tax=Colocasia esculenta TaxID=4460 RepID=A0A843XNE5_COLES|nr:hypothetical protein [Colocasia esculenta]
MKRTGGANLPESIPTTIPPSSPKPPAQPADPLPQKSSRSLRRRRRLHHPAFPGKRLGWGGAAGGRRSGPTTPLLRWKFHDAELTEKRVARSGTSGGKARRRASGAAAGGSGEAPVAAVVQVSARRLAAGIWQRVVPEFSIPVKGVSGTPFHEHLHSPYVYNLRSTPLHKFPNNGSPSPASVHNRSNGVLSKFEHALAPPSSAMERATKWDPGSSKVSDEFVYFNHHMKLFDDQQVTTVSIVSSLKAEVEQARARINELEAERRLSKKKLDHFLKKLAEEKASWRKREHEKVRAIIDDIKDDLKRERKSVQRMEIVNSKLVNELAEAKLSAKRYLQEYEKERKAREIMEEVCDELAKEMGEDKAEVEAIKKESLKIREEVEDERKMLQMAEVWREERVQMKLIDAKLALEEKYSQLCVLQSHIEAFLHEIGSLKPDVSHIKEAEFLRDAANSLKVQEIKEFVYQPPLASEDIFSVFEELQAGNEPNERENEPCYGSSPASHASKMHTVSPEINGFCEKPMNFANGTLQRNGDMDDESDWETDSHAEEQGSSNSPDGSDPSVNGICESNASASGTDWEGHVKSGKANSEVSEACWATTRQSRKKTSSMARLWRSSCPSNGENCKVISVEATNGRVSNGNLSPDVSFGEAGLSPRSVGQFSSPDSVNPHITQGMKGYIEWPGGMQKHSLKAKLLEARIQSQKIQLRQVLKQKI